MFAASASPARGQSRHPGDSEGPESGVRLPVSRCMLRTVTKARRIDHRYYRVLGKQGRGWDRGHSDRSKEVNSVGLAMPQGC